MNITNRNYTSALTGIQVIHTPSERSVQQLFLGSNRRCKFTVPHVSHTMVAQFESHFLITNPQR